MRLLLFLMWLLHWLPLPILGRIGKGIGTLSYYLIGERRHIALTNLRLCFPEFSEEERKKIAKEHFQCYGRSIVERAILWWSPVKRLKRLMVIDPAIPLEEIAAHPIIFLCPHFVCLEMPGAAITMESNGCSIYTHQRNPVLDRALKSGRVRFNPEGAELYAREEGVKPIIRALRKRIPFLMLPDMDFGSKDAEFVPFFGQSAATLTAPARLALATGAKIIPVISTFLPNYQGWKIKFYPEWENFPKEDMAAAARYMNEFIEERIKEIPAEYFWTHRRFKTRPFGEPSLYD